MRAPHGLRDLLPEDARVLAGLSAPIRELFAGHGYERIVTPAFEHAEVIAPGLAQVDRNELLRLVDPETGEVALLRPDFTPQVARVVATRLSDRPGPWRISYEGSVLRRRLGRARHRRQITQVGIECVGIADLSADVEVLGLAARSCRLAGLRAFRLELGQVQIGQRLLEEVPALGRHAVAKALGQKDPSALERVLAELRVPAKTRRALLALPEYYGPAPEVLRRARKRFRADGVALDRLAALVDALDPSELGDGGLGVDLGEVRGHAYYTGVSFQILASGPGEPIGGGGRYDDLVGHFGAAQPATGFGLSLHRLFRAIAETGGTPAGTTPLRVVALADAVGIDALRELGVQVATLPGAGAKSTKSALAFARAWNYDAVLAGSRLRRLDGSTRALTAEIDAASVDELQTWARS